MRKAIVTAAFGNDRHRFGKLFSDKLGRWTSGFIAHGEGAFLLAFKELPSDCPSHLDVPFAFKAYAILAAIRAGFTSVLWADVSVVAVRSISPLWAKTEDDGYWLTDNGNWNCGQWACDTALPLLGVDREEAFRIPMISGAAFALNFEKEVAFDFFLRYMAAARDGAFAGPFENSENEASADPRVLGHRHDQTAASVIAHSLGMALTKQPCIFAEVAVPTGDTVLVVER